MNKLMEVKNHLFTLTRNGGLFQKTYLNGCIYCGSKDSVYYHEGRCAKKYEFLSEVEAEKTDGEKIYEENPIFFDGEKIGTRKYKGDIIIEKTEIGGFPVIFSKERYGLDCRPEPNIRFFIHKNILYHSSHCRVEIQENIVHALGQKFVFPQKIRKRISLSGWAKKDRNGVMEFEKQVYKENNIVMI